MPWIFMILLVANLGYFVWGMMQGTAEPQVQIHVADTFPADKRLKLAPEKPQKEAENSADSTGQQDAQAQVCYSVGPFTTADLAGRFSSKMHEKQITTVVEESQNAAFDYWVFVPPQVDREHAEQMRAALGRQGLAATIVDEDPYTNAISLGHFSKPEQANGFLNKMLSSNVQAELRKTPQTGIVRWVYVAALPGSHGDIASIVDNSLTHYPNISRQPVACRT